jgi:receptor protein-tyrosine kinase
MELQPGPGVADVLAGRAPMQHAVRRIVGGLDVLPAGPVPPNSSELLGSPVVDKMLDEVGKRYNFVILDVPALLPVADAAAVAARADGAVLVVRYGKTSEEQVAAAMSALEAVQAPVLGIALNGTPAPRRRRRSRPYPRQEQKPRQPQAHQPQVPADDTPTQSLQKTQQSAEQPLSPPTTQTAQPKPGTSEQTTEQPPADKSPDAAPTPSPAAVTSGATTPQNGAVERPSPSRRS